MKRNIMAFCLLLYGNLLYSQSALSYIKAKLQERMSQYVPIALETSSGLIFKDGIHASLESFAVSEANTLNNGNVEVKGTFVAYQAYDGTNIFYNRPTKHYIAILNKILDEYEVIKIIFSDSTSPNGYWYCLYPQTTEKCYPSNFKQ